MQTTSATWKALWASGNARVETKAVINGTDYTEISDPIINRALMQNGCSIGNAVSATCQFAVRTNASIPKSAEVIIKYRLNDGTTASEWLNAGTFYISHRQRDPVTGVLSLECYDALLKANARMPKLMPWTTEGGVPITTAGGEIITLSAHYPRSMASVIHDLAILLGDAIRIDPSTTVETGDAYVITEEDISGAATINQILCRIAAANGGNWIMTPDNYLKLVPLKSAEGAASASSDVVDVVAVTGSIDTGNTGTITGIRYSVDNDEVVAGDETGIVIDANVSAAVAADLQTKLVGMTYQAYGLKSAIYDPATELGDYVRAGANGEIRAVLCAEVATLGLAYRGDMSAPEIGELADEYPYISLDKDLTKYVDESVAYLDNSLTLFLGFCVADACHVPKRGYGRKEAVFLKRKGDRVGDLDSVRRGFFKLGDKAQERGFPASAGTGEKIDAGTVKSGGKTVKNGLLAIGESKGRDHNVGHHAFSFPVFLLNRRTIRPSKRMLMKMTTSVQAKRVEVLLFQSRASQMR